MTRILRVLRHALTVEQAFALGYRCGRIDRVVRVKAGRR